jgi:glycosyltransferase involved in cell wall biosynthesis
MFFDHKTVSVIIPSYNATKRLSDAVNSALEQTYRDIEIIVVDDNDPLSDGRRNTEKIMSQYVDNPAVRYIKHDKNRNGAAARNTGIKNAKGYYICFLDDDDIFYDSRVEKCVEFMESTEADAVYTDVDIFKNDIFTENRKASASGHPWKDILLNEGLLGTGSNLFLKKDFTEDIGCFDEDFIRYQDLEFMIRYTRKYTLFALNQTLVRKNITDNNIPPYRKYKENKQILFSKFSELISELNEEERDRFYIHHYTVLLNAAIKSKNREYIDEAVADLKDINYHFRMKDYLKIRFPGPYIAYTGLGK